MKAYAGKTLVQVVEEDIRNFFIQIEDNPSEEKKNIFFNENDFQMHLSIYLTQLKNGDGTSKYDDVDIEYFIPIEEMPGYIWHNKNGVNIDIVVEKDNEFVPIELKYPTAAVDFDIKRFGEVLRTDENIIKNQGAQNLVMYHFWKDVKRIEVLKSRFSRIKNGIALFLTNDDSYLKSRKETAACSAFSMNDGTHPKEKHWNGKAALLKHNPDFEVSKNYDITWKSIKMDGENFHYNLLTI